MFPKILSLLGFILLIDYVVGTCNVCQINNVACRSEKTFSLCVDGKLTSSNISCPENKVCTNDPNVCLRKDPYGVVPSCNNLSSNLDNNSKPNPPINTDIANSDADAVIDATTFCTKNKQIGTFKAQGDTTCNKYYVCRTNMNGFKGYEFNCKQNYYNPETNVCQKDKPSGC